MIPSTTLPATILVKRESLDLPTNAEDQRKILPKAPWYQTERVMKAVGKAFLALSALVLIASVIACNHLSIQILVSSCIIGKCLIDLGFKLNKKNYWNDPIVLEREAEKVKTMTFVDIIKTYDWEIACNQTLLSKKDLSKKFFEHIEKDLLSFSTLLSSYRDAITKYNFIEWRELYPLLMDEVKGQNMDLYAFRSKYATMPLRKGILLPTDPWYKDALQKSIKDNSYQDIKRKYSFEIDIQLLTPEMIQNELFAQAKQCSSFTEFFQKQGGKNAFWKIVQDNVIDAKSLTEVLYLEATKMTTAEFIETFGWELYKFNVLDAKEAKAKFLEDITLKPLSEVLNEIGLEKSWEMFDYHFAKPSDLTVAALKEIADKSMDFKAIIETFGWKIFQYEVLTGAESEVAEAFRKTIAKTDLPTFWNEYGKQITKYHNLPSTLLGHLK